MKMVFWKKAEELLNNPGFSLFGQQNIGMFLHWPEKKFPVDFKHSDRFNQTGVWMPARVLLGFQFILIFVSQTVTTTVKELLAYTGFYVEKALKDAGLSGLPLTLHNFNDSIMETKHKEAGICWEPRGERVQLLVRL